MRKINRDYLIYIAVVIPIMAVIFIAFSFGHISNDQPYMFMGVVWVFLGSVWIFWGIYYMKNETWDVSLTINFFVKQENLDYYDTSRMTKDMGKMTIVMGAVVSAGAAATVYTGSIQILTGSMVILVAVCVGFYTVRRRSKYLKDPAQAPQRGRYL
jgi:hypothetical protein